MICMYWGNYNNTSMLYSLLEPKPKLLNHTKVTLLGDYHSNKVVPLLIHCSWNQPVLGNESSFVLTETGSLDHTHSSVKMTAKDFYSSLLVKTNCFYSAASGGHTRVIMTLLFLLLYGRISRKTTRLSIMILISSSQRSSLYCKHFHHHKYMYIFKACVAHSLYCPFNLLSESLLPGGDMFNFNL